MESCYYLTLPVSTSSSSLYMYIIKTNIALVQNDKFLLLQFEGEKSIFKKK